ncbi:MAG: hypothetical protein JF628_07215 [Sphingomonas sp.]|nr:hypothetical protein [Sphingomonas sp.]
MRPIFLLPVLAMLAAVSAAARPVTAIVGATLVDVSRGGRGTADIADAVVLVRDGRIVAVGPAGRVRVPRGARIVRAEGQYLVPGLIDGFGAVRNARFAAAYLDQGVTSVIVPIAPPGGMVDGETHVADAGRLSVLTARPIGGFSPIGALPKPQDWAAFHARNAPLDRAALEAAVADAAHAGYRLIAIGPDVAPDQLAILVSAAHAHGLAVSAELAWSRYADGIAAGVDLFARNDKYLLSLADADAWKAYRDDPVGPGGRTAAHELCGGGPDLDAAARAFGASLGHTALMPVLVMEATADDVGAANPWSLPAARFMRPSDLDDPVDPVTGARPYLDAHPDRRAAIQACALRKRALDRAVHSGGATYLAGSSAPSYGIMPGSGLHEEIRLLATIGLTPREALASATGNYAPSFRDRGLIAPGRRADLLLLRNDPRRDVTAIDHITMVIVAGERVDLSSGASEANVNGG